MLIYGECFNSEDIDIEFMYNLPITAIAHSLYVCFYFYFLCTFVRYSFS